MARAVVPRAGGELTKEKILLVAQKLFADLGFDAVSMRQVGAAAEVPFALVTYHFSSKLGLYQAVFRRWSGTISQQRLDKLRKIRIAGDPHRDFTVIARAFVEPMMQLRHMEGGRDFVRLMAREIHDPVGAERGIVKELLDPIAEAAIDALRRAAPWAPAASVTWAYHFATGALAINYADTGRVERISQGECRSDDLKRLTNEVTRFIAAGFEGSLARPGGKPSATGS